MIDPRLNRFDRLAPYYDVLANLAFGGAISRSHKQNFHLISNGATVLILGGGSGKWLRDFLNIHPSAKIYFIEASKKMLERAIGRSQNNQQITFIHGTEDDVPSIRFDVVITHFFLDMYSADQLEKLIGKIRYLLERKGVWLVSDFEVVKTW
ncbi:MAG: class I SAM-dependent methyltransferase, partial [Cyclobacteriaceae bacterium]